MPVDLIDYWPVLQSQVIFSAYDVSKLLTLYHFILILFLTASIFSTTVSSLLCHCHKLQSGLHGLLGEEALSQKKEKREN